MVQKNKKYQSLIATSKDLFWRYGFRRVSIEEICREANVSKMTFYKFFKNKEEVARTLLDKVYSDGMIKFREIWDADIEMEDRFQQLLQLKAEGSKNLSMEFVKDLYSNPESELASYMNSKTSEMYTETIGMYKEAQKKGWIRKDLNVEFFFFFMQKSITILQDDQAQQYFSKDQDLVLEVTRLFLYGMQANDKNSG